MFGRIIGLRIVPPRLQAGEEVRWSARANRMQNRIRYVGGRLYVTDRRLLFARTKIESHFGGKEWSAPLADFESASKGLFKRSVTIVRKVGSDERFFVESASEAAAVIKAAIQAQSSRSG